MHRDAHSPNLRLRYLLIALSADASFASSPVRLLTPSPIDAFGEYAPRLFTYSPIHLFTHSPTCRLADLPKRSTTHSPIAIDDGTPVSQPHLCQLLQHWKMVHQPLLLSGFLKATNATHKRQRCTRPSGETAMGIPIAYPAILPSHLTQRSYPDRSDSVPETQMLLQVVRRCNSDRRYHRRSASQEQRDV
ncbi:hypothetical protein HNQ72_005523 [Rhizobium wenxiniae]|uniref:Uncharacterized protein n=1 Tax=Rhizobium wenxiniae TaxID=1737357 RepID=A0A7W9YBR7_9HYPH|nr:hypothetical protein [Rhizobium wenxiniae]